MSRYLNTIYIHSIEDSAKNFYLHITIVAAGKVDLFLPT
jgi:hypothetical protein